jgi:hypothetical protein
VAVCSRVTKQPAEMCNICSEKRQVKSSAQSSIMAYTVRTLRVLDNTVLALLLGKKNTYGKQEIFLWKIFSYLKLILLQCQFIWLDII